MQLFPLRAVLLGVLAASMALPAGAGTVYSWTTDDGVASFTEDARRIPERYRASAQRRQLNGLDRYDRFTPADGRASAAYQADLEQRLERLRFHNGDFAADAVPAVATVERSHPIDEVALQSLRRRTDIRRVRGADGKTRTQRYTRLQTVNQPVPNVGLGADVDGPPVVIEERRVRDWSTGVTRHVTVIRQGDEILGVIKPPSLHTKLGWDDDRALEE